MPGNDSPKLVGITVLLGAMSPWINIIAFWLVIAVFIVSLFISGMWRGWGAE